MAVYIDNAAASYGRMIMCHMVADTLDELHQMADKIGVDRKHYHDFHYNICKQMRDKAFQHGAVKVTTRQAALVRSRLRNEHLTPA
jgi:hypothetical protein